MKYFITKWNEINCDVLKDAIFAIDQWKNITSGTRVFIKPNLTFPFFKKGVTTPPDLMRALVEVLLERGAEITIGEGGPSLDAFDLHDSFVDHGLYDLKRDYGVRVVHLRDVPVVSMSFGSKKTARDVPIPRLLLEDTDFFINLPVAKVHCMTLVTLSIKNLWGCIAAKKRFVFHPSIEEILHGLLKALPNQLIVCDGRYVLTENGPMFGITKPGAFLAVSDDPGAFDVAMCRLMDFDPRKVRHIRYMINHGAAPSDWKEIELNADPATFRPCEFVLKRTLQNYIAMTGFHSSLITWLGYDSFTARFVHKILYALKPNPLEKEMAERKAVLKNLKCEAR